MTRNGLDVDVLRSKLEAIDRATATLRSISPMDASRLRSEPVTAAAVERLTCRLVDLAADINTHISSVVLGRAPENYRDSFDLMERRAC
ncbi:HepT-like ribonuclease domain-containing protein [Actinopolyspora sp. H202]|uniref:HepT-like ribonuclease domain-containing protein n=1 Tax=Actinopolyspora sp. H202 TaxID=1500456 RepID=UPI003EE62B1C